jgi:transposase
MAPHSKELTTEQKEIILILSDEGFSSYKIQNMTGINSRTIQKFLKMMRERGKIENLSRSGGRCKTTPLDDRILFRSMKTNRRQTLKDVTARFNQSTGCNVSSRTVCRRLFREGYKRRVVSKKITISQVNRQWQVGFCRRKLHWTVDQWSLIIFSDETKIILGQNHKIYVWRKADERLSPECVGRRDDWETTCRASVMF